MLLPQRKMLMPQNLIIKPTTEQPLFSLNIPGADELFAEFILDNDVPHEEAMRVYSQSSITCQPSLKTTE